MTLGLPFAQRQLDVALGLLWLLAWLAHCMGEYVYCPTEDLLQQENKCNPYLGEIGTAILASDGTNFTTMCRAFDQYVNCMEPSVINCDPSPLFQYWTNKLTYSGEPYNCVPPYPTMYNASDLVHDTDGYVERGPTPQESGSEGLFPGSWVGLFCGLHLFVQALCSQGS